MRETDNPFDEGGAPGWRARYGIDAAPAGFFMRRWWDRTPAYEVMLWALGLGFGLPWLVMIGGLLAVYFLDRATEW